MEVFADSLQPGNVTGVYQQVPIYHDYNVEVVTDTTTAMSALDMKRARRVHHCHCPRS